MLSTQIEQAAAILKKGGLVAFPTETVYGLGADATQPMAVRKIFEAKGRPTSHPLIVHISRQDEITDWATEIPECAWRLAKEFWPGPLTLVLRRASGVCDEVSGGLPTVALRVPKHDVALALLNALGHAIAAPSANRFTHVSPTCAEHVRRELGDKVDMIVDAGPCAVGLESTIVDLSEATPRMLRPGAITQTMLETTLGQTVLAVDADVARYPGGHPVHYAPQAQVRLVQSTEAAMTARRLVREHKRVMVWAPGPAPEDLSDPHIIWVTMPNALDRLGQALYATLHEIDAQACDVLVVALSPQLQQDQTIGIAIRDRLQRASQRKP